MFYDKFIPSGTAKRLKRGKAITRNFNRTFPSSIYQFSKKRRQQHKTTNSGISLQWESKQNFVLQADYWKSPTPSIYVQIFKPLLPWEIVVLNPPPLRDTNAINALSIKFPQLFYILSALHQYLVQCWHSRNSMVPQKWSVFLLLLFLNTTSIKNILKQFFTILNSKRCLGPSPQKQLYKFLQHYSGHMSNTLQSATCDNSLINNMLPS